MHCIQNHLKRYRKFKTSNTLKMREREGEGEKNFNEGNRTSVK